MTWSKDIPQCDESAKIRWECVPYFHGRVLDIGCGGFKTFPHWIGVDNGKTWGKATADVMIETAEKLDIFANRSCDAVFSSHLLEHIEYENVPGTLAEWMRVIKPGGHLMIYVPDADDYPKVGEFGANPDHKWNCTYENITAALETLTCDWDMIEFEKRNEGIEYSLWFVVKKLG